MFARLFVVLLLAFSLVGMRGMMTVESPVAIEIVDTEPATEGTEATVSRETAASDPLSRNLLLVPGAPEGPRSLPDPGRVFRPPRSLGS